VKVVEWESDGSLVGLKRFWIAIVECCCVVFTDGRSAKMKLAMKSVLMGAAAQR
jgi:hypothetical protein